MRQHGGAGSGRKKGLQKALSDEIAKEIAALVGEDAADALDFDALEDAVRRQALDGTGVPMRKSEVKGRRGKQKDGSAKTRETKPCTVWSAESRDADGKPMRDDGSVTYSAAIESAAMKDTDLCGSEFRQRVLREARRRCFERALRPAA